MAHDLWNTRCAILTGVPEPGTRPRLKRQKFYAVPSGVHKGMYESYSEVQLRHCQAQSFPAAAEAQQYIDTYRPPVTIELSECTEQDLVIFTDGSFTKAGSKPATAGWGFLVQPGSCEEATHEGSGPLATPEAITYAIQMSLQWCLDNPGHIRSGGRIVVCPDSSFAISRVSSTGKVKAHATYVQNLRELLKRVEDTYPTVTVLFHKVEEHSVRDDREARGNNRVDSLVKSGAESYVSISLPRPRLPPSVASRSVPPISNWPGPAETGHGHPPASPAPQTRREHHTPLEHPVGPFA